MSGHSKWHSIKHKKALIDAKRGKLFTKVIKELTVAARMGGSDPGSNPRLRTAIQAAKDVNMPKDTMDRAVKKGAGELEGMAFEEIVYEGYGPGGVAIIAKVTTDNKNRTAAEIRHAFGKHGGNLGTVGCVGFMFNRKGVIDVEQGDEDKVMEAALDAGADDVLTGEDGSIEVLCAPADFESVKTALERAGLEAELADVTMRAENTVALAGDAAERMQKLLDVLEDLDDVQAVYHNAELGA